MQLEGGLSAVAGYHRCTMTDQSTGAPAAGDLPDGPPRLRALLLLRRCPPGVHRIVVPADVAMVSLLGPATRCSAPSSGRFRGRHPGPGQRDHRHRATWRGSPWWSASSTRCSRSSPRVSRSPGRGGALGEHAPSRPPSAPADVLTLNILSTRGRTIRPKTLNQKALRRRDRRAHGRLRHRPRRNRQDLPRDGEGCAGPAGQAGQPDHPDPPAVEAGERLGSSPARSPTRSTPTCARSTTRCTTWSTPSRSRAHGRGHDRGRAAARTLRGRTLNDAFIILDEAQNTSADQMKMFLTRLGFGAKDGHHRRRHPGGPALGHPSGLRVVQDILDGIEDVHFAQLSSADVVRHRLVAEIVECLRPLGRHSSSGRRAPPPVGGG